MNLCIIFKGTIYDSSAPVNRILSLSKGLSNLNVFVTILCVVPPLSCSKSKGKIGDINFDHLTTNSKNIFSRKLKILYGLLRLKHKIKKENYDVVYIYGNSMLLTYLVKYATIKKSIKLVKEMNEYPILWKSRKDFFILINKILINFEFKQFDGLIVMTRNLYEYFRPKIKTSAKIDIILMTTEMDRFEGHFEKKIDGDYIAYCGYMGGKKDGVTELIHAFSLVSQRFNDIKLLLVGDASETEMLSLRKLVKELNIESQVIFTGKVSRDLIPNYLVHAKVLTLARPNSKQSYYGFPTKLGEYLSTGKPVLVTNVGEISNYLCDGENAYIANPDDINDFANKLLKILNNYEDALKVGEAGKDVVKTIFNYKVQSEKLYNFLRSIVND